MKCTVETLSPTRVRLAVEVPFDELKPSFDHAYKRIGGQVKVPGFRPGKVPGRVLEQRLGRPVILEEVVQHAVPLAYDEAIRDSDVRPISRPDIEVTRVDDGDAVAFTAEVDVRPTLDLPAMDSISATVEDVTVSDEDIDEQVAALRERFGTLTGVSRAAQVGDHVSIDLVATVDGVPVEGATATELSHEVGSGQLIDGLDEALVGLSEGETATFQTRLSGTEQGRDADVAVTVRAVKEKDLPPLDDEFAQLASEFDTLEELREDSRGRLTQVKQVEQGAQARDHLLEGLVDSVQVPLPESVVTGEVDYRRHTLTHQLEEAGLTLEEYLAMQEQSVEEFDTELRTTAEKAVATQLIVDAYADQEQVSVTEQDLTQHIVMQARRYRVTPEQFAQQLSEGGQLATVMAEVRRAKVISMLLASATVTDAGGRPVDLSGLLPAQGAAPEAIAGDAAAEQPAEGDDSATAAAGVPSAASAVSLTGDQ